MTAETRAAMRAAIPQLPQESNAAYEALLAYVEGGGGGYSEHALRMGRHKSTIWHWATKNNWRCRTEAFWRQALPKWAEAAVKLTPEPGAWRERTVELLDERRKELMEREWAAHEELVGIAEAVIRRWKDGAWDRRAAPLGALTALIDLAFRLGRAGVGGRAAGVGGVQLQELGKQLDAAYRPACAEGQAGPGRP